MDEDPTYTKQSADAMLPEIRTRLEQMRTALAAIAEHSESIPAVEGNGTGTKNKVWLDATRNMERHLAWFASNGIILRDISEGILDFPSYRDGQLILLCWRGDEPDVAHWHSPETGFASRQPLED